MKMKISQTFEVNRFKVSMNFLVSTHQTKLEDICDAIRQNESEVAQIGLTFLVFYIVVRGIIMPHLSENPVKIGLPVLELQVVENNRKQRKFFLLIGDISKS